MSIDSSPDVSVLTTTYNGMPYLVEAVDSILAQTFTNFEFVIVNDGSTDDSRDYLDSIQDPRVRVYHEPNRGTSGAANFGLAHCRGKYIARFDADDVSCPERLQVQFDFMEANPQVALVGSQLEIIGEQRAGFSVAMPLNHEEIYNALLNLNHGMSHSACFFRAELIRKIGGYWDSYWTCDDWDMFLRIGEVGELANLPSVQLKYRTLPSSLVGSKLRELRRYYAFASELARRRQRGEPPISLEDFFSQLENRSRFAKWKEAASVYALGQYRMAVAEVCGGKPVIGYTRLGWAAICSPLRTANRLKRIFTLGFSRFGSQSVAKSS